MRDALITVFKTIKYTTYEFSLANVQSVSLSFPPEQPSIIIMLSALKSGSLRGVGKTFNLIILSVRLYSMRGCKDKLKISICNKEQL